MNEITILPDDPRLTAYALGELEGEELARVEAAVRGDPALRSAVDAIRDTARSIETALAAEAVGERPMAEGGRQTAEGGASKPAVVAADAPWQRAAIIPGHDPQKLDGGPRSNAVRGTESKLLRFPSLYFVIGGLAAACFAVMVALHEPRPRVFSEQKRYVEVPLVPSPTATESEAPVAITRQPAEGGTAGTLADTKASIHFDAQLDKPKAGKLTPLVGPMVGRLAQDAPSGNWAGDVVTLSKAIMARVSQQGPLVTDEVTRVELTSMDYSQLFSKVTQVTRVELASVDYSQLFSRPRTYTSGGPVTMFESSAAGSRPLATKWAFGDLAVNLGGTKGNLAFGTTGGLVPGFGGAMPVGQFSGARSSMPADRYDWKSAPQSTSHNYYYPPDEKFVYRAVPYGSTDLLALPQPPQWLKPAAPIVRPAPFNTEDYAQIRDNDFVAVAVEPLSTFALDVDTASYANLRRFLERGERPPRDAVRIEELVNYFPYRYAPPVSGDGPFAASLEVAAAPWNPQHRLVRIGLKTREVSDAARPAANLVFLVDVSGSMAAPAKLPLVQESLRMLVGRLRADDHVAIVTYATQATLVLPATPVGHGVEILAAVDGLTARGSTNGAMGLQLAYDVAKANVVAGGVNRVILCTDGDFNVGVTQRGDLVRLIEAKAKSGVFLTVLGFGTGNLKDATLEQLANHGHGNYGYVDSAAEAKRLLVEQAGATLVAVAKDVKVQVEFNPAVAGAYRLIGYENRLLRKQDFTDDRVDAGEIGAGHTVTALYEVVPVGATADLSLASTEPLKYRRADDGWRTTEDRRRTADGERQKSENPELGTRNPELGTGNPEPGTRNPEPGTLSEELLTVKIRYKEPAGSVSQRLEFPLTDRGTTWADASDDFKFAASVASFGMILRESPYKGTATLASVAEWARQGLGNDAGGQRNEFLGLVSRAQTMVQ
jgi:Ca-activated chloride channel family protein